MKKEQVNKNIKTLMLKYLVVVTVLYLLFWSNICIASCEHTNTSFSCVKYISNFDGDTITFDIPNIHPFFGYHAHVRISGIDAPEIHSKDACEKKIAELAKNRVAGILLNASRIDLINLGYEKYGRILADVIADNINIGQVLLNEKLSYSYTGDTKKKINWCNFKDTSPQIGKKNMFRELIDLLK